MPKAPLKIAKLINLLSYNKTRSKQTVVKSKGKNILALPRSWESESGARFLAFSNFFLLGGQRLRGRFFPKALEPISPPCTLQFYSSLKLVYHDLEDFCCPDGVSSYSFTIIGFLNDKFVVIFKVHIHPSDLSLAVFRLCVELYSQLLGL